MCHLTCSLDHEVPAAVAAVCQVAEVLLDTTTNHSRIFQVCVGQLRIRAGHKVLATELSAARNQATQWALAYPACMQSMA